MDPYANTGCVLRVNVHCDRCKMKLMNVLSSISGVYSINIDAQQGLVDINGQVDPNILLGALARSGEHAELVRVKLQHPALGRRSSSYSSSSSHYDSYGRVINDPHWYERTLLNEPSSSSYYHRPTGYYPSLLRSPPHDYNGGMFHATSYAYDHPPLARASYVPSGGRLAYHDDESFNSCTIM